MNEPTKTPSMFISYSWTNGEHVTHVAEFGTRLMDDGVDVVRDQWSLVNGQDVTAFMGRQLSAGTFYTEAGTHPSPSSRWCGCHPENLLSLLPGELAE